MADLLFNITSCDDVTISTPAPNNFIQEMQIVSTNTTDVQSYDVSWSNNCCTETTVEVAPLYDFGYDVSDCTTFVVLGITFTQYEIILSNINGNFIESITAQAMNLPNSTPGVLTFTVLPNDTTSFDLIALASAPTINYDIVVTTKYGYVYTLHMTLTQVPGTPCVGYSLVFDATPVTYPDVPDTIVYSNPNLISLNALTEQDTILTGVYQVSICEVGVDEVSECLQNHAFINCGDLKCFVIRKYAECVDTDVMNYYETLTFANDCTDNITYDEVCAIYEVLNIKLATDGCYAQEDDCNCQGARTKANKMLTPVRKSSTTKSGCGCG